MTTDLPDDVVATVARIARPTDGSSDDSSPVGDSTLTGALADLRDWWVTLTGDAALEAVHLVPSESSDAMSALRTGIAEANRAIDSGATLIVPRVAERDDVTARALTALLTKRDASAVLGQPDGMSDALWMQTCTRIRDRMAQHAHLLGDYSALLQAMDARNLAAVAGILLGAAARRTPCLIDGTDEWAAALVSDRLAYKARAWWREASTSPDPARTAARERIDLAAGLDLHLSDDCGHGADAALALLALSLQGSAGSPDG